MAWIAPRYEAHQRKRWLRPDAYRFAAPGTPEARMPGYLHPWAAVAKAENEAKAQAEERETFERELLELRRELDELKLELAARRAARLREAEALRRKSDLAFERFLYTFKRYAEQRKAGFNPGQPRDDHGKWTDSGRSGNAGKDGRTDDQVQSDELSASKKADIVRQFGKWTARQFISRHCRGSINREMPGEFENVTIADIYDIAKGGDARARTCLKLLKEPRFRK